MSNALLGWLGTGGMTLVAVAVGYIQFQRSSRTADRTVGMQEMAAALEDQGERYDRLTAQVDRLEAKLETERQAREAERRQAEIERQRAESDRRASQRWRERALSYMDTLAGALTEANIAVPARPSDLFMEIDG